MAVYRLPQGVLYDTESCRGNWYGYFRNNVVKRDVFELMLHGDLSSRIDGTKSLALTYDELGNLTKSIVKDGSVETKVEYVVDGLGRRVESFAEGGIHCGLVSGVDEACVNEGSFFISLQFRGTPAKKAISSL